MKFTKKRYYTILLMLSLALNGCQATSSGDGSSFDESYYCANNATSSFFFEYNTYFFKGNETRNIYIGGPYTKGVTDYVRYTEPDGSEMTITIGYGKNMYIDDGTPSYFVCWLPITTDDWNSIDDWQNVDFHVGNEQRSVAYSSSDFNIQPINNEDKREMKVYYAHLENYDILNNVSPNNPQQLIVNAFAEANMDIPFIDTFVLDDFGIPTDDNVLPATTNNDITYFDLTNPNEDDNIVKWLRMHGLKKVYENNDVTIHNKTYLIGMKEFIDATSMNRHSNETGVTINFTTSSNPVFGTRYSIIWTDPLLNVSYFTNDALAIANNVTHELGHAAGSLLPTLGSYYSGLTDDSHEMGHDGAFQRPCIMRYVANMDKNLTTHKERDAHVKEPHFCEGHKQMLLNVNWTETEEAHGY